MGTRQLFTIWPSIITVHAPHSPSPQPSFVPVKLNCSRRTSSRRSSGKACSVRASLFTLQLILIFSAKNLMRPYDISAESEGYHEADQDWRNSRKDCLTTSVGREDIVLVVKRLHHQMKFRLHLIDGDDGWRNLAIHGQQRSVRPAIH